MRLHKTLRWTCAPWLACFLLTSCQPGDPVKEKRIEAFEALRGVLTEVQISASEHGFTGRTGFLEAVKSGLLTTNKSATTLRAICEVVWINSDTNSWRASVTNGLPTSRAAMIGKYQVGAKSYFIGITFDGHPTNQDAIPDSGFVSVNLKGDKGGGE